MKKKKERKIPSSLFPNTSAPSFLSNVEKLTISELIELYAYAEAIVETVREPLVILDKDLRIKSVNKGFYKVFKVKDSDTVGRSIFEIGNGSWDIPKLRKLLKNILPKNSNFDDFEVNYDFPTIGKKIMVLNARRIILEGFNTELILLAIEDRTAIYELDKKREEFISMASHELKTPITSIMTFMNVLQKNLEKGMDHKSSFIFSRIITDLNKLNELIQNMLDIRVIKSGQLGLHKANFSFDDLVNDCIETMKILSPNYAITLEGKANKVIYADRDRISQVIMNLLMNAVKYSPEADKLVIKVSSTNSFVSLSVQDFGIGIENTEKDNIFQPFYRVKNNVPKGVTPSMGLGLHIASEIIKRHKGKISVKSKKGEGSTFSFTLPIRD